MSAAQAVSSSLSTSTGGRRRGEEPALPSQTPAGREPPFSAHERRVEPIGPAWTPAPPPPPPRAGAVREPRRPLLRLPGRGAGLGVERRRPAALPRGLRAQGQGADAHRGTPAPLRLGSDRWNPYQVGAWLHGAPEVAGAGPDTVPDAPESRDGRRGGTAASHPVSRRGRSRSGPGPRPPVIAPPRSDGPRPRQRISRAAGAAVAGARLPGPHSDAVLVGVTAAGRGFAVGRVSGRASRGPAARRRAATPAPGRCPWSSPRPARGRSGVLRLWPSRSFDVRGAVPQRGGASRAELVIRSRPGARTAGTAAFASTAAAVPGMSALLVVGQSSAGGSAK